MQKGVKFLPCTRTNTHTHLTNDTDSSHYKHKANNKSDWKSDCLFGVPRWLCVTVVNILRHCVVVKQIIKSPLEIRTESVHQTGTWNKDMHSEEGTDFYTARETFRWARTVLTPRACCSDDSQGVEEGDHCCDSFNPAWRGLPLHHICALILTLNLRPLRETPGVYQDKMWHSVREQDTL